MKEKKATGQTTTKMQADMEIMAAISGKTRPGTKVMGPIGDQEYPLGTVVAEAVAHTAIMQMIAERTGGRGRKKEANILREVAIKEDNLTREDPTPR